jgi:hypothetical protein
VPPNPSAPPPNPSGHDASATGRQPLLSGKGILNTDGVLYHGPNLFPKKPFDDVVNLKMAHGSSSGSGNQPDVMVPRYFKLDFPAMMGRKIPCHG